MKDYYKILGVDPSAEAEVISSAYRALVRKYHPDTYKGSDAEVKMKELNEAYEVLNNHGSVHEHGQCNPIQPLKAKGVEKVVVSGMGARALMNLQSMGIRVYRTLESQSISDIINSLENTQLEELTIENSCNHHNCH